MRVAIMQGRALPPVGATIQSFPAAQWRDEFAHVAAAGLDGIEWIYDLPDEETNPLALEDGRVEIAALRAAHDVDVWSCCADWFMARPLATSSGAADDPVAQRLHELIEWSAALGIRHIVLPCVDASRIASTAGADRVVGVLSDAAALAARHRVELHLETDLAPAPFAALLDRLPFDHIAANYDSGNSAALGYSPREEFAAYGSRIRSLHLKDRVRGGTTVPPGTGAADFDALFESLARVGYGGDVTLQVARGLAGDEVRWLRQWREWFAPRLDALTAAR